jgi:hypothetical protein
LVIKNALVQEQQSLDNKNNSEQVSCLIYPAKIKKMINNAHPQPQECKNAIYDLRRISYYSYCEKNYQPRQQVKDYLHGIHCLVVAFENFQKLFNCKGKFHFLMVFYAIKLLQLLAGINNTRHKKN